MVARTCLLDVDNRISNPINYAETSPTPKRVPAGVDTGSRRHASTVPLQHRLPVILVLSTMATMKSNIFEMSVLFETGELNTYVYDDSGGLYRRKYV